MLSNETQDDAIKFLEMMVSETRQEMCYICRRASRPLKQVPTTGTRLAVMALNSFARIAILLLPKEKQA
jgi:hypothetical protein